MVDDLQAQAKRELSELADSLPGTDIEIRVAIGSPSGLLLEASEHAHLLVIGSRGKGGFAGLLLGSVGTQVAAHAECPTVVMRGAPRDSQRIVVGVDGSPNSEQALAFAFDLASRHGWDVVAVHAWEVPSYDIIVAPIGEIPIPLSDVADEEVRLAAEVLAGFRTDYPDVRVHEHLVRSSPVDALLDAATDAVMIVVGTRGRGPTLGAVLGSVSNGVLHKAHIPVAVVPYRDPGNTAA
jgi:nucleotide-binding universal stress UspA family protein